MSIEQMKLVCAGAKASGLILSGDNFIGYKFLGGDVDSREAANQLLQSFFPAELLNDNRFEYTARVKFLGSIRDEDYSHSRWNESGSAHN
jgi:hypothetical protein